MRQFNETQPIVIALRQLRYPKYAQTDPVASNKRQHNTADQLGSITDASITLAGKFPQAIRAPGADVADLAGGRTPARDLIHEQCRGNCNVERLNGT